MKHARTRLWSVLLASAALGCADQQPPPPQPAFERPGDVAFVCLGKEGDRHVALPFDANNDKSPCRSQTTKSDIFQMHALVTQTTRGEVAVVNLERGKKLDARRDIPGFTFVPVGEFPSAIVVPSKHPDVDPRDHPGVVYVANFGSRDIYALDVSTMIDLNAGESAVMQVVPVRVPGENGDLVRGGPFDMVVSPSGDALLVSVPEHSAVLRMPIRHCVPPETECILTDQIQVIPMGESLNRTLATPAPPVEPEPYQLQCGDFVTVTAPPGAPPELPDDLTTDPRPSALALDAFCADDAGACTRRLLVADAALPLLHVIDLNAFGAGMLADPASAVLDPWVSGATTSDVAVTPRVPRSLDTRGDDTQYVYAIDSVDGSVLVMQDGVLLHPNGDSGQRFDRVPLGRDTPNSLGDPRAVAIDVATPGFDDTGTGDQYLSAGECSDDDNGHSVPRDLNGVFLSVATSDGTILMVDVHDMELGAPPDDDTTDGDTPSPCRVCPDGDAPVLTRHHLRLANTYEASAENGVDPLTAPRAAAQIQLEGRNYDVRSDGTTTNPTLPELACLPCEPPLLQAFPGQVLVDAGSPMSVDAGADGSFASADASFADGGPVVDGGPPEIDQAEACPADAPALICALGDPWVSMDFFWELAYEGPIPLENGEFGGHRGQFRKPDASDNESGTLEYITEIDFCTSGILGDDDVPDGTRGDALVITSPLPDPDSYPDSFTKQDKEDCAALQKALDDDPEYSMRFAIRRAYQEYLVLEEQTIDRAEDLPPSYEVIVKCMNGRLMEFQVRTHDAFTVRGRTASGFESPVVTSGPNARCVRDPAADPLLQARAVVGTPFRNRFFELTIKPPRSASETAAGTRIGVSLAASTGPVFYDATPSGADDPSVVPVELRYLDIEKRLFLIDAHQLGLVPIKLQPFPRDTSNGQERYN